MPTINIDKAEDLRAGDRVTFSYQGHEFTGEAWAEHGRLFVGPTLVGRSEGRHRFITATREVPDLPTEFGSLIEVTRWDCECDHPKDAARAVRVVNPAARFWMIEGSLTGPASDSCIAEWHEVQP